MELPLACLLAALALAERFPRLRFERSPFLRRGFATDLVCLATGAVALGIALRHAVARLVEGRDSGALDALPTLLGIALATILYDLAAWATHRLLHRSGTLWRVHQVHHSSPTLDWIATFRAHGIEHALRHLASPVFLLLAGFPVGVVATATAIHTAFAAFGHANLRVDLRFLEPLFVTPRLHRLHHVPTSSERNFGTIFSLWDRLRGTLLADADAAHAPLGVPGRERDYPQTWPAQLVEPFRRERRVVAGADPWIATNRSAGGRTSGA